MTYTHRIAGCTPQPLLSYLQALGLMRTLTQADPALRGAWQAGAFTVWTSLEREELLDFFLERYEPSPILAPWNNGSGFWDSSAAGQALAAIEGAASPRLAGYQQALAASRVAIRALGLDQAVKTEREDRKDELLRALRNRLPDEALPWLDAAVVLTEDGTRYAPLLGTGGNDGRLDFTANFMQRLAAALPFTGEWAPEGKRPKAGGAPLRSQSRAWLAHALFLEGHPPLLSAALGQFHPGGVGGANATGGFKGDALVNPWSFIFMVEGALLLAGTAVRRLGADARAKAAFPFTVDVSSAGSTTFTAAEAGNARAELWLPLWAQPASLAELAQLFGEGRAQLGARQARTGLDFARAVAQLGVDRGITAFERYGFLVRNGQAYLAAPLGRIEVKERPSVRLLDQLDSWLYSLRRAAGEGPQGLQSAVNNLERHLFAASTEPSPARLQSVLISLGRAEQVVALSPKLQEAVRPLEQLGVAWLQEAADESAEWRLAVALASVGAVETLGPGHQRQQAWPIRLHWEPLAQTEKGRWEWTSHREVALTGVVDVLSEVLERRLLRAEKASGHPYPIRGVVGAPLAAIERFLLGDVDEQRLLDLAFALATLRWGELTGRQRPVFTGAAVVPPTLPRSYAFLKLLFHDGLNTMDQTNPDLPRRLGLGQSWDLFHPDRRILTRLRVGHPEEAITLTAQQLRVLGRVPLSAAVGTAPAFVITSSLAQRLAASLLFPVGGAALDHLAAKVLMPVSQT